MKFLILESAVSRTGGFICATKIASSLPELSTCNLVCPCTAEYLPSDLKSFGKVYTLFIVNPGRNLRSITVWLKSLCISSLRLLSILLRGSYSHLIVNDWYLLQGILCRLLGYRGMILTWVRLDPLRFGRLPAFIVFRLIALTSTHLVVVSRHVQRRLPPGISSTLLYDCLFQPPLLPTPPKGQRLVFVGNYTPGKGQDLAIEAFARITSRHPEATLEFHGSTMGRSGNARWRDGLEARAENMGLADRIHFYDFAADPRQVLQGAYAALNFSEAESFSLTVLEASAAGLPVIATSCGGPAEIIVNGITGLLVPVGDVEGIAVAMNLLLGDSNQSQEMGAAGAAHVQLQFDPAVYRQHLVALISNPPTRRVTRECVV